MLLGNILIVILFIFLSIFPKNTGVRLRNLLLASIAVSLFINVGYVISKHITYSGFAMIYFLMAYVFLRKRILVTEPIRKELIFIPFAIASVSLIASLLVEAFGNTIEVIPVSTVIDDVYDGSAGMVAPSITNANFTTLAYLLMFFAYCLSASEVIRGEKCLKWLCDKLIVIFNIAMVVAVLEFGLNNFVAPFIFRKIVFLTFGIRDSATTYDGAMRYGRYGFSLLFTEQSYIIILLAYYAIQIVRKNTSNRNLLWIILSIVTLLLNGSTTGLMLVPLGFITLLYLVYKKPKKNFLVYVMGLVLLMSIGSLVVIMSERDSSLLSVTLGRISALIEGGRYSNVLDTSSAIRNFGNAVALEAWTKSPIFGLGLGTTRAYGLLVSGLVSFGVLGLLSYFIFMKIAFRCTVETFGRFCLLITVLAYLIFGLNISYTYSPALVAFILPFASSEGDCADREMVPLRSIACKNALASE